METGCAFQILSAPAPALAALALRRGSPVSWGAAGYPFEIIGDDASILVRTSRPTLSRFGAIVESPAPIFYLQCLACKHRLSLLFPLQALPALDFAKQDFPGHGKGRVREGALRKRLEGIHGRKDDAFSVLALENAATLEDVHRLDDQEPTNDTDGGIDGGAIGCLLPLRHGFPSLKKERAASPPTGSPRSRRPVQRGSLSRREPDDFLIGRPSLHGPIIGSGSNPKGRCRPTLSDHVRNHTFHDRSDLFEAFGVSPPVSAAAHKENLRSKHVQEVGPGVQARGI